MEKWVKAVIDNGDVNVIALIDASLMFR
jgi:hypothetical protein